MVRLMEWVFVVPLSAHSLAAAEDRGAVYSRFRQLLRWTLDLGYYRFTCHVSEHLSISATLLCVPCNIFSSTEAQVRCACAVFTSS